MRTLLYGTLPSFINYMLIYLSGMLISRWFGASLYGQIAFALAVALIISYLFEYGFAKTALQLVARYLIKKQLGKLRGFITGGALFIIVISIVFTIASIIIFNLLKPFLRNIDFIEFSTLIVIAYLIATSRFFTGLIQGRGFFVQGAIINKLINPTVWIALMIAAKIFTPSYLDEQSIIHFYTASWAATMLYTIYYALHQFKPEVWHAKTVYRWRRWLTLSSAYTTNSLSLIIINQIGLIALGMLAKGSFIVGVYAALLNIINFMFLMLVASNRYVLPLIVHAHTNNDKQGLYKALNMRFRYLALVSIIFFIAIAIFGKLFLSWYGTIYENYYLQLILLATIAIIESLLGIAVNVIVIYGHQRRAAISQLLTAITTIALTFIFIPYYGIYGAIAGYAIAKVVAGIYNSIWLYRKYGVNVVWVLIK